MHKTETSPSINASKTETKFLNIHRIYYVSRIWQDIVNHKCFSRTGREKTTATNVYSRIVCILFIFLINAPVSMFLTQRPHMTNDDYPSYVEKNKKTKENTIQNTATRNITPHANIEVIVYGFLNNQSFHSSLICTPVWLHPAFWWIPSKKKVHKVSSQWHILPLWRWWLGSCRVNLLQQTPTNLDVMLARRSCLTFIGRH